MIPDLDLQLQVVLKALRDTVMPAIEPAQRMAVEQLGLSIATLAMVRARLPYAAAREWQDLSDAVALAKAVASDRLARSITHGEALLAKVCPEPRALTAARQAILTEVSAEVNDAQGDRAEALMRIVIEKSKPSTDLARAWSKVAGFEPDPAEVPELESLLAKPASAAV
ncbi:hypothetical protein [Sphingomonas sp. ID0503]|uniref:hypothetical protein n=1 Tax=Sphingomonas sp. ID0503 TaxID=3399691 RepID=UPI003AFB2C2E